MRSNMNKFNLFWLVDGKWVLDEDVSPMTVRRKDRASELRRVCGKRLWKLRLA